MCAGLLCVVGRGGGDGEGEKEGEQEGEKEGKMDELGELKSSGLLAFPVFWFPVFCPGLHFSASIAPGARRMATCCSFYAPPKTTIISILAAAKRSLRRRLEFVSRNAFDYHI